MRWECKTCTDMGRESGGWWSTRDAAQAAAVWHAYHEHRENWIAIAGADTPPKDPLPEMLGRQLAPWEYA